MILKRATSSARLKRPRRCQACERSAAIAGPSRPCQLIMYQAPSNPDKAGTALLRVLFICATVFRTAAQSSADPPLKEGDITRIECRWDRDEALPGFNPDSKPQKGLWHYDVFVPEGYAAQTQRR